MSPQTQILFIVIIEVIALLLTPVIFRGDPKWKKVSWVLFSLTMAGAFSFVAANS